MRSALLRVLTDLYVQKPAHTPDEERHYAELALRLIDSVDAATRAAVAAQLGKHLAPPRQVIERLAEDLLESTGSLRSPSARSAVHRTPALAVESFQDQNSKAGGRDDRVATAARAETNLAPKTLTATSASIANELNQIFFAANAHERRLILLNLHVAVPLAAEPTRIAHDPSVGLRLEVAALARKRQDFVQELAQSLKISREQARRIVDDKLGEPIVIAAKALGVRRDRLYRILLFVNTAVGHSVERVHALAQLYDEITFEVAQDLVATWQGLGDIGPNTGTYQRHLMRDQPGAQVAPAMRHTPFQRRDEHREAS